MGTSQPRGIPPLDRASPAPFYRQIYDRVCRAVADGLLKPGDRIPSARALAIELGLARGTVDLAYSLLAAEGYILPRGQAGTIIAPDLEPRARMSRVFPTRPVQTLSFRPDSILPFQMGLPALDAFPRKIWAQLGARSVRAMQPSGMAHPSVFGMPSLRVEIAAYLQISRGIDCSPAQVFVTSGYRHTLGLVCQALLKAGDEVWVENPGFPPTRELVSHLGIQPVAVPVDGEGLVVSAAINRARGARASGGNAGASKPDERLPSAAAPHGVTRLGCSE